MKNRNVVPLVLCCLFYVGNAFANVAFANVKAGPPAQITLLPALDTLGNSRVGDQLGGPDRGPLVFVANGQQEIDPTWFDPWPPNKTVVPVSRPQGDIPKNHRKTVSAPPVQHKTRARHFVKAGQKETR